MNAVSSSLILSLINYNEFIKKEINLFSEITDLNLEEKRIFV